MAAKPKKIGRAELTIKVSSAARDVAQLNSDAEAALDTLKRCVVGLAGRHTSAHDLYHAEVEAHQETTDELTAKLDAANKAHAAEIAKLTEERRDKLAAILAERQEERHEHETEVADLKTKLDVAWAKLRKAQEQLA